MKVTRTEIPDVLILEPKVFGDARGFFLESFNEKVFREATGVEANFVQDNHSRSAHGGLRGLHYQLQQPQGKLLRVVRGRVFHVAVDVRKSSRRSAMGWERTKREKHRQFWCPRASPWFLGLNHSAEFL